MLLPFKSKLANIYMHDGPFNFKCKANRTKRLLSLSNLITFFHFIQNYLHLTVVVSLKP